MFITAEDAASQPMVSPHMDMSAGAVAFITGPVEHRNRSKEIRGRRAVIPSLTVSRPHHTPSAERVPGRSAITITAVNREVIRRAAVPASMVAGAAGLPMVVAADTLAAGTTNLRSTDQFRNR